jgi:ABC-type uncharacterized transport system fused permease/ATPase subunit
MYSNIKFTSLSLPPSLARSNFTDTSLGLAVTVLTAAVDLASFSGILYSIYPPLFGALALYSVGGTAASLYIGRPLVGLNFAQEAAEANFRYGLVRVRENAESIAFYGGEGAEAALLGNRLKAAVDNYLKLLAASRNLSFFTSFYRFAIGILPAAVVAPLFFRGEIEFGVVNQVRVGWGGWVVEFLLFDFGPIAPPLPAARSQPSALPTPRSPPPPSTTSSPTSP